jgi:hypothetical protein
MARANYGLQEGLPCAIFAKVFVFFKYTEI